MHAFSTQTCCEVTPRNYAVKLRCENEPCIKMNDKTDHEFLVSTSTDSDLGRAVEQVCREMRAFKSEPPELAVVYISHHHAEGWDNLANELVEKLKPKNLIGCSAESVVETMFAFLLRGLAMIPKLIASSRLLNMPDTTPSVYVL